MVSNRTWLWFTKPVLAQWSTRTMRMAFREDSLPWLKEQDTCTVTLWNDVPISVSAPNFVELEIADTDPGLKGDTASGGTKPATLSTGAIVKVPLFLSIGEVIRIDTRTGEYQNRVKS